MAEGEHQSKPWPPPVEILPSKYDLAAKWDACFDLSLRRVAAYSLAGAFAGLLLFRSPVKRWASVAFGAGMGSGSAYIDCSYIFNRSPDLPSPKVSNFLSVASHVSCLMLIYVWCVGFKMKDESFLIVLDLFVHGVLYQRRGS